MIKILKFLVVAGVALFFCGESRALSFTEATDKVSVELLTSAENFVPGQELDILIKFINLIIDTSPIEWEP